jgi:hypothetical protein
MSTFSTDPTPREIAMREERRLAGIAAADAARARDAARLAGRTGLTFRPHRCCEVPGCTSGVRTYSALHDVRLCVFHSGDVADAQRAADAREEGRADFEAEQAAEQADPWRTAHTRASGARLSADARRAFREAEHAERNDLIRRLTASGRDKS